MFLDLRRIAVTVLPVLLGAHIDQWTLISQEVEELYRTIYSCLLQYQNLSSNGIRCPTNAGNPIAQMIHWSSQQTSRPLRAHSADRAIGLELKNTPQITSLPSPGTRETCEVEPSSCRIDDCAELGGVASQISLGRTSPLNIHGDVRSIDETSIASIENATSAPELTLGDPDVRQSAKSSDVKYEWDNKVLLLRPSADEWDDFPTLLLYALELGADKVGAFKVQVPEALRYDVQ